MDLSEFLLARIAEDEHMARYVLSDYAQHSASWDNPCTGVVNVGDPGIEGLVPLGDGPLAILVATFAPSRVLAECAAKRRIVARHGGRHVCEDGLVGDQWDEDLEELVESPCDDLKAIALPYADHPDCRAEWR